MPDGITNLPPDEQMARLANSRDVLMEWVNEYQDGEPSPEVVEVLEQLGERMDALEDILNEQEQARADADEAEDVDEQETVGETTETIEGSSEDNQEISETDSEGEPESPDTGDEGTPASGDVEVTDEGEVDQGTGEETVDGDVQGEGETDRGAADEQVDSGEAIAPNAPTPEGRFAYTLLDRLSNGTGVTDYREFYQLADEAWGGTREDGVYTEQDAYDVAEAAGNLFIRQAIAGNMDLDPAEARQMIEQIQDQAEAKMVSQSVRTQERQDRQQYSTPFSYGFAVNWVANIKPDDVILEPSAGNGNLAVYGGAIGADVHVNEIDAHRQGMLRLLAVSYTHLTLPTKRIV